MRRESAIERDSTSRCTQPFSRIPCAPARAGWAEARPATNAAALLASWEAVAEAVGTPHTRRPGFPRDLQINLTPAKRDAPAASLQAREMGQALGAQGIRSPARVSAAQGEEATPAEAYDAVRYVERAPRLPKRGRAPAHAKQFALLKVVTRGWSRRHRPSRRHAGPYCPFAAVRRTAPCLRAAGCVRTRESRRRRLYQGRSGCARKETGCGIYHSATKTAA